MKLAVVLLHLLVLSVDCQMGFNRFSSRGVGGLGRAGSSSRFGSTSSRFGSSLGTSSFAGRTAATGSNSVSNTRATVSNTRATSTAVVARASLPPTPDPRIVTDKKTKGKYGPKKVYDANKVRKYNIVVDRKDLKFLKDDVSAEEYVPCSIVTDWGDKDENTFKGVGCRYKGAVGSLLFCVDRKTGRMNGECNKLSFKVDGNKFREDNQKINGLKRLGFHGMPVDKSMLSERTAYNLMRSVNMAASRVSHGEMYINGEYEGLYAMVQEVNEALMESFFEDDEFDGKGPVYKDMMFTQEQLNLEWIKDHHQTGKKRHEEMLRIGQELQAAPEGSCEALEKNFDTESIVNVTAFNDLVGQSDDWRYRHNFFWYMRNDTEGLKLVMIPWDYDRLDDDPELVKMRREKVSTWHKSTRTNDPVCKQGDPNNWDQQLRSAYGFEKKWIQRMQKNSPPGAGKPLHCDKIIRLFGKCLWTRVQQRFSEFSNTLTKGVINKRVDAYADQIQPYVAKDTVLSNYEWQAGVSSLKRYLETQRNTASSNRALSSRGSSSSSSSRFGSTSSAFGGRTSSAFGGRGMSMGSRGGFSRFGR